MFNSKLASLEARIARLESSLQNKTATGWSPQSGAPATAKDILSFFSDLYDQFSSQLKNVKYLSKTVATGTFKVDFSDESDASVGLYVDNSISIDFKLEIKDSFADLTFFVGGSRVSTMHIPLLSTKAIIRELYRVDGKLRKIYEDFADY